MCKECLLRRARIGFAVDACEENGPSIRHGLEHKSEDWHMNVLTVFGVV